jgi:carbonic anhydrase/acetyltransferase-like protein (isoleucine patch superfamily)
MSIYNGDSDGDRKYELLPDQQDIVGGVTLYRVRAVKDFGNVKAGTLGGFVASERNLSHEGLCWVGDDARVYGEAVVSDDARVYGRAHVYGRARIEDRAQVLGNAQVFEDGWVFKNGIVFDNAMVFGRAQVRDDALVFGRAEISERVRVLGSGQVSGDTRHGGGTVVGGDDEPLKPSRSQTPRGNRQGRSRKPRGPHP